MKAGAQPEVLFLTPVTFTHVLSRLDQLQVLLLTSTSLGRIHNMGVTRFAKNSIEASSQQLSSAYKTGGFRCAVDILGSPVR